MAARLSHATILSIRPHLHLYTAITTGSMPMSEGKDLGDIGVGGVTGACVERVLRR